MTYAIKFIISQTIKIIPVSGVARISLRGDIQGVLGMEVPQQGPGAEPRWGQGQIPQKPEITVKNGTENSLKYNTNNKI